MTCNQHNWTEDILDDPIPEPDEEIEEDLEPLELEPVAA